MGVDRCSALLLAMAAGFGVGCHLDAPLESCETDFDCSADQRCHLEGRFCELDTGPVIVGVSLPLTGPIEEFAAGLHSSLRLVEKVVNDGGGLLGRKLKFRVLDDATSVAGAQESMRLLVRERVAAVIGPVTSDQALATQAIAYEAKILQISSTAGAALLSSAQPAIDRYFFRTVAGTVPSAAAIALKTRAGFSFEGRDVPVCKKMAVIYAEGATGQDYLERVSAFFEKLGGCVTFKGGFSEDQLEFGELVSRMIVARPQCATLVAFPDAALQIAAELRAQTRNSPAWDDFYWMGTTSLRVPALLSKLALDGEAAKALFGGDEDSQPDEANYREFRRDYNEFMGYEDLTQEAPVFASNTFDAGMLAALSIEQAGSATDRERIRDAFWEVTGRGKVVGPLDYREARAAFERGELIHYTGASSTLVFDDFGTLRSQPAVVWGLTSGPDGAPKFAIVARVSEQDIDALVRAEPRPDPSCQTP